MVRMRRWRNPIACVQPCADSGLNGEPFERIFEFRASDDMPPNEKEANEIFAAYMEQLQQVVEVVDEFDRATQSGEKK